MVFNTGQIPSAYTEVATFGKFDTFCHLCGYPASLVLGQPDFNTANPGLSSTALQTATAVATDGNVLAVADTDNNRVLIWKTIPTVLNAPADIVLGQVDFTSRSTTGTVNSQSLRGPQGVWIQNGRLFVADTQNFRVLIWNSIPTQNNQAADLVLGQPNFTSANQPPVTNANPTAAANQLLNPVSVTSDGTHLFVADLGFNRVLIWDSLPTQNTQPANHVIGQPNMTTSAANNASAVCASTGTDSSGNATFPAECAATLNFPRYALSDGTRLFIADGGNDRVLIFNHIPTTDGALADIVLGQPDFFTDVVTSQSASIISTSIDNTDSVDTIRSPMSLAYDGTNLYASDPYGRRVLIYTPGDIQVPQKSVLNAASLSIRQEGFVTVSVAAVVANDTVGITIGGTAYTYTVKSGDTGDTIVQGLVNLINANGGDKNAIASVTSSIPGTVFLSSKSTTLDASSISLSATSSNTTNIVTTASGSFLTGGTSAIVAPGTLVQLTAPSGTTLSDTTLTAPTAGALPVQLGGVEVSIDGFQGHLMMVSPTQIVAQIPFEFFDRTSSSIYVRTLHKDNTVTVTTATSVQIAPANPGLFAVVGGGEPRPVNNESANTSYAEHQSGNASATVSIDGSVKAGDVATITVAGTAYNYTVTAGDSLGTIAQHLADTINGGSTDPNVTASVGGAFSRVVLTAKVAGPGGSGISVAGSASSGASVVVTAYSSATCCGNSTDGGPVTLSNPALPNELVTFYATGLGLVSDPNNAGSSNFALTGLPYYGPQPNSATQSVSATVNAETGQVVSAGLAPGGVGVYAVQILMPSDMPANQNTPVYIAQNAFISNIVTMPSGGAGGAPFTASPNPVLVPPGAVMGTTTLSWHTGSSVGVEVHLNSPTGPLLGTGPPTGSSQPIPWITEGTTFFLLDLSNHNALAALVMHVKQTKGVMSASPNPIYSNTGTGKTTVNWTATSATRIEIHLGSPGGPLWGGGGQSGAGTTGNWVTNGTTFYLQDATKGNPTDPANTLATTTVAVQQQPVVFQASPNPIQVFPGTTSARVTLSWYAPYSQGVNVLVGSPTGGLISGGAPPAGSCSFGATDGTQFFLQDFASGAILGSVTVHLTSIDPANASVTTTANR
jgi:uncharacterized protein (TIGR03437 family)